MPNPSQWAATRARQVLQRTIRARLEALGYQEVETPLLVPAPGMEPHIRAFEVPFVPETDLGRARTLYLHTSPEYAMKRLLADGSGPIFQICKVFRNGEVSPTHNPEFTMLELYRPRADYRVIMDDLESVLAAAAEALGRADPFGLRPYERVTVREAIRRETGIDLREAGDARSLTEAARRVGVRSEPGDGFDDVFFRLFLERVEPRLGRDRPAFLIDYPASMAALARLKPSGPDRGRALRALRARSRAGQRLLRADRRGGAAPPAGGGARLPRSRGAGRPIRSTRRSSRRWGGCRPRVASPSGWTGC